MAGINVIYFRTDVLTILYSSLFDKKNMILTLCVATIELCRLCNSKGPTGVFGGPCHLAQIIGFRIVHPLRNGGQNKHPRQQCRWFKTLNFVLRNRCDCHLWRVCHSSLHVSIFVFSWDWGLIRMIADECGNLKSLGGPPWKVCTRTSEIWLCHCSNCVCCLVVCVCLV